MSVDELEHVVSLLGLQDNPVANEPIAWHTSLETTAERERALTRALIPFCNPPSMHKLAWTLPANVREEIGQTGVEHGFTVKQTFSFRRGLLKCRMGMKGFMALQGNDDSKARLIAEAFEAEIERFVRTRIPPSVVVVTEAQRKAAADAEGTPYGPTPDLTFEPPISINGRFVAWIDAKMLYASHLLRNKKFMPENRLEATASKYNAAFGPGAFVFGSGFCGGLKDEVSALLLDSTPLDMTRITSVIESDQSNSSMTLEAMRAALGLTVDVPTPVSDTPVEAGTNRSHNWDAQIRCGTNGIHAYHYHICTRCGVEGVRKKISNKKAAIYSTMPCVALMCHR